MKLNEPPTIRAQPRSDASSGRGIGSGKGKTGGRGVKGQKARTGVAIRGFSKAARCRCIVMRMPKRGFGNIFAANRLRRSTWRASKTGDR